MAKPRFHYPFPQMGKGCQKGSPTKKQPGILWYWMRKQKWNRDYIKKILLFLIHYDVIRKEAKEISVI